jgi:ubiquinone/menaquinone biosynthesis C-methylase UbiE
LSWPDDSFDAVTGFSAFQFADDKVRALTEARRVSRGPVAVVIPSCVSESGIALVFKPLFPSSRRRR